MNAEIKKAFDGIRAEEALKAETLRRLYAAPKKPGRFRPALALALSLILCLGGLGAFLGEYAVISMDINPSLEMGVNIFGRVISLRAYNQAGEELVAEAEPALLYKPYASAIQSLVSMPAVEALLLGGGGALCFGVSGSRKAQARILDGIAACPGCTGAQLYACSAAERAAAQAAGLSMGKYRAYLALLEYEPDLSLDEARGLSMGEIRDRIRAAGGQWQGRGQGQQGRGCGHGRG